MDDVIPKSGRVESEMPGLEGDCGGGSGSNSGEEKKTKKPYG